MLIQAIIAIMLAGSVFFGAREIASWSKPTQLATMTPKQRSIRFYAIFLLVLVLCLGLGGTYLRVPQTQGQARNPKVQKEVLNYLAYWFVTGLFFLPIIPLTLLDARQTVLRLEVDRQQLLSEKEKLRQLRDATLLDTSDSDD
jgi:hypothetical protein